MNTPTNTAKILRTASRASVLMASALVAFGAAPLRVSAQDEEVRVGDFVLLKSVDFLTDAVTYRWARSGDPIPPSDFGDLTQLWAAHPGDNTLELSCPRNRLAVGIYYEPAREAAQAGGVSRPHDRRRYEGREGPADADLPERTPVTVQMRFDSDDLWPALDLLPSLYGPNVMLPRALVERFMAAARTATRLRVRVTPARSLVSLRDPVRVTPARSLFSLRDPVAGWIEVEFSLIGITRAVEHLGCGA